MKLTDLLTVNYPVADQYSGINSIEDVLTVNGYLVIVDEESKYVGILFPSDLIKRPYKLAIDCLGKVPHLTSEASILKALELISIAKVPALPVFDHGGFSGIVEDVSLVQQQDKIVKKLEHEAEQAGTVKKRFLQNLSHEIRTPLNGVTGFMELLADEILHSNQHNHITDEYVEIVKNSSNRFLQTMSMLVDAAIIYSGDKPDIYLQRFNLKKVVEELNSLFSSMDGRHNTGTSIKILSEGSDFEIISDQRRIMQILFYLIDNAIKYSSDGEVVVKYQLSLEPDKATIAVCNKGTPIDMAYQCQIFELFEKGSPLNDFKEGLGLGLNLAKILADALGCFINFESDPNETCFCCTFEKSCLNSKDQIYNS